MLGVWQKYWSWAVWSSWVQILSVSPVSCLQEKRLQPPRTSLSSKADSNSYWSEKCGNAEAKKKQSTKKKKMQDDQGPGSSSRYTHTHTHTHTHTYTAKSLQLCLTLCEPHRRQATRLPRPWDSPGKNTGVGCHFLFQCMKVKRESEVTQSCPTLSDPMDCSLPGSSIHGIFQAGVMEWGAMHVYNISEFFCQN